MDSTTFNSIIAIVAAIAVAASGLLFWTNRGLEAELDALRAARSSVERDAKAAVERANVAERSIEEIKSEMAKVQAANVSVNHSVTQLRNQLEQVQIQANTAREDFEKRLKATAEDLGRAQADSQRLGEDIAKVRAEKDDAEKRVRDAEGRLEGELKRARDELAQERAAREVAERNARDAATGASTGAPAQTNP